MHTVSLFPHLFDYQMLGIFMLRATLGLIFIYFWYEKVIRHRAVQLEFFTKLKLRPAKVFFWVVSSIEGIAGVFLVIGLYTQGAAIVTGTLMLLASFIKHHKPSVLPQNTTAFYIMLAVASFALLFLGPGAFAIDLPL
jgi:uncharacterized membrane protein YphA (DoxX/SURF4 family)